MSEKNRTIREQADEIRKELDDLIGDEMHLEVESDPEGALPVRREPSSPAVNYAELKGNASIKAKKTISSLMRFYLDADIIERDEYIKAKKKIDEMTMASLIYQLQAGERALTILLETIEGGEIAPRMFEVLGTLQKSMLDIIKSQTMYLMAAEESTKRIARDIEIYKKREDRPGIEEGTSDRAGTVQRGTKELMAAIQAGIKGANSEEDEITEIEIDEEK
jgi:hypothetical protein